MPNHLLCGALVATTAACLATVPGPAQAAAPTGSSITVRVSDHTPDAGQAFVLRGRYRHHGAVAAGHTVRVQTYADGRWSNIVGARVQTRADGTYRLRLILEVHGVRDLRVKGVAGGAERASFRRFVVQVL